MPKELPTRAQAGACAGLWIAWLGALAYVIWKEYSYRQINGTIHNLFAVSGILLVCIPAVLSGIGVFAIYRLKQNDDKLAYRSLVVMTTSGVAILLFGCWTLWILAFYQVRE